MGSNPTLNTILFLSFFSLFFFFFFSFLFFSHFLVFLLLFIINTLFFLSVLHKTLFANYDSACIIVKFKSSLRQIKLQVLYEFKLIQFHVYKAYNLSLSFLDFTFI